MEKYSVVLDQEKVKTAKEADDAVSCPKCGAVIHYSHGEKESFPWCPKCGTEPWEKRPDPK